MQYLLREYVRQLLQEIAGGYYTVDNLPYSYEDYPEIDIEVYPDGANNRYMARVFTDDFDTGTHTFAQEEEARAWCREQAEKLRRNFLSTDPDLDTMIGGKI